MTADCSTIEGAKSKGRSRVGNGTAVFLNGADGRSALARRYRDILNQLISDIGGDPSEAESLIIRRVATIGVWCEQAETAMAGGAALNIQEFTTATNALRRLLADIGLERRAREIVPSLDRYLEAKAAG